ncbi:adenosylcobinamide amidohydrolase [Halovenus rubra]|uniref:Adenosylcobinamide amidohydrolase n=2 Tax=Halovenus rubra TaxID=869890 RepID=A0ACC7E460_9EURY|nr:adenosylcobinamide amidohydrolase [Halovenus rubra]
MFETEVCEGVLQVCRPSTLWLSSGWQGGTQQGATAYNISVPEGWDRQDLDSYVRERQERAGFYREGPTLLTGVNLSHARGARYGPVTVYATAGVSNPGVLPSEPPASSQSDATKEPDTDGGTVNLIVGSERALGDGALANLLAVVVEAKTATLLAETGFPGTTTDAVIVGCDPNGQPAQYSGTATPVGAAARACTRDALLASLGSRYPNSEYPATLEDAEYGVQTTVMPDVFTV